LNRFMTGGSGWINVVPWENRFKFLFGAIKMQTSLPEMTLTYRDLFLWLPN
jgi:predicted small integral membrane protein